MKEFNAGDTVYKICIDKDYYTINISSVRIAKKNISEAINKGEYTNTINYYDSEDKIIYIGDYFSTRNEAAMNSEKEYNKIISSVLEKHDCKLEKLKNLHLTIKSYIEH